MRYLFVLTLLIGSAQAEEGFKPVVGDTGIEIYTDTLALKKTSVNGKYLLLRQIKVPQDAKTYGAFHDFGRYGALASYAGHKNVPAGYWVYAYPYWFVWAEKGVAKRRPWGPEQATGEPNSAAGDQRTAWAPRSRNGGTEWLLLEYQKPVRPIGVIVYENNAPGALRKITAYKPDGTEVVVWRGTDPSAAGRARGTSLIPIRFDFDVARIKLTFDTKNVKGWNEIDAVGLLDASGKTHWATGAHASSFYGDKPPKRIPIDFGPIKIYPLPQPANQNELAKLRAELEALKKKVAELEKKLAKKNK